MHKILLIKQGSTKKDRSLRKWGLSFLIDDDIIFDTFGSREDLIAEIKSLSIDLNKIRHVVISHDHWDHIEGLSYILERNKDLTVYLPFKTNEDLINKIISSGVNLELVNQSIKIKDGIFVSKQMVNALDKNTVFEHCLVIDTTEGLVVITGCAHPGIDYMVKEVKNDFKKRIRLLIGGFHLKNEPEDKIRAVIDRLIVLGVKEVAPIHCTGEVATGLFKEYFKDRFIDLINSRQVTV